MKTVLLTTLLAFLSFLPTASVSAQEFMDRVVAVVNSDIITQSDLKDRVRFNIRNSGRPENSSSQEQLLETSLDQLIQEVLVRQHAKNRGYNVSTDEVADTVKGIEQSNNQSAGSFDQFAGELKDSAYQRIRADIIQNKIMRNEIMPRVNISQTEVTRILEGLAGQDKVNEWQLAQIFIPVADNASEDNVRDQIQNIYTQVSSGADFGRMAQTFSQDPSGQNSGLLGWFNLTELAQPIQTSLENLSKGQVTEPVRSSGGWHIFKILDTRESEPLDFSPQQQVALKQLIAAFEEASGTPQNQQEKALKEELAKLTDKINSRQEFDALIAQQKEADNQFRASGNMGWLNVADLPSTIRDVVTSMEVGELTKPLTTRTGVAIFMVTDKRKQENRQTAQMRARIADRIAQGRAERILRRLMRDMRRDAYIDIRL